MKMEDVSMGDLNELNIATITVIDGSVTNVTVILDPVLFEHRGVYICIAVFNVSLTNDVDSDSQEYELIVHCKLSILLNFLSLSLSLFVPLFLQQIEIYHFNCLFANVLNTCIISSFSLSLNVFLHSFCSQFQIYWRFSTFMEEQEK